MIRLNELGAVVVPPEWIDANGHMNVAYYLMAFDQAAGAVFDRFGMGEAYVAETGLSLFTVDVRIRNRRELVLGDTLAFSFRLIAADAKRVHFAMAMHHADIGTLAASFQQVSVNVDLTTRRSAPIPAEQGQRLASLIADHRALPVGEEEVFPSFGLGG